MACHILMRFYKVGINRLKDLNLRFITQAGGKIENELCDEIISFSKK